MKSPDRARLWRSRIAAAEKHPVSVRAFCIENGINPRQLYRWRVKLVQCASAEQPQQWLSVDVPPSPVASVSNCITFKIAGGEIDLRADFDGGLLRSVVQALAG